MALLNVKLKRIPKVLGIYGKDKNFFPASASLMHPDAANAFIKADEALKLRVSDMLRSAEESLRARAEKTGVQPPGYSAHNFGFAIDIHVEDQLARTKMTKAQLDAVMKTFGWYCHRRDSNSGSEWWHYNYLGNDEEAAPFLAKASKTSTAIAIEEKIKAVYSHELILDPLELQEALKKMRFYNGDVDGQIGPRTAAALAAFQRAWALPDTGKLDPRTERTLAFVSSTTTIVE